MCQHLKGGGEGAAENPRAAPIPVYLVWGSTVNKVKSQSVSFIPNRFELRSKFRIVFFYRLYLTRNLMKVDLCLLIMFETPVPSIIQGEHSGCDIPPVDTKPNVAF